MNQSVALLDEVQGAKEGHHFGSGIAAGQMFFPPPFAAPVPGPIEVNPCDVREEEGLVNGIGVVGQKEDCRVGGRDVTHIVAQRFVRSSRGVTAPQDDVAASHVHDSTGRGDGAIAPERCCLVQQLMPDLSAVRLHAPPQPLSWTEHVLDGGPVLSKRGRTVEQVAPFWELPVQRA